MASFTVNHGIGTALTLDYDPAIGIKSLQSFLMQNLYKFRVALARQATGGAVVTVACVGDSTTAGALSDADSGNYRMNSWPKILADLLSTAGYPSSSSNAFGASEGPADAGGPPGSWDSRIAGTGSFGAVSGVMTLGGGMFGQASAAAGTLSFTPGVSTDTCDIWYYDQGAVWTTNIDGGATISTITGGNTLIFKKATISYAAGAHVINLVWSSGLGNVVGFDAYTAAVPKMRIWNFGAGGYISGHLSANWVWGPLVVIGAVAPDLTIISIGINDWAQGIPIATYTSNVQTFITKCLLSGSVILMTPFPSDASVSPLATQAQFITAMQSLATLNNVAYVDENFNLVSKARMTAVGLGSDVNHPNNLGYAVIARDAFRAIKGVL
jgi:lysophospholipase L1-like esterase